MSDSEDEFQSADEGETEDNQHDKQSAETSGNNY